MKTIWTKQDFSFALNQEVNFAAQNPRFNSLDINPGDFFIALPGNNLNGHHYIADALNRGAVFVIASKIPDGLTAEMRQKIVLVSDTNQALLDLANYRRRQSNAKFIAITGSSGKTITKTVTAYLLSNFGKTFASYGNFNNHLGVPITLASIPQDCEYAVVEIGMNNPGEIKPLTDLVKPDISIITNVLPAHIGNFKSILEIAQEKAQIFRPSVNKSCAIFYKSDNDDLNDILLKSAQSALVNTILTFGEINSNSDATLVSYNLLDDENAKVAANIGGMLYEFNTKLIGRHNALNLLSVILASYYLDLNLGRVTRLIEKCQPLEGRGKVLAIDKFGKRFSVIDDSYNANPASVQASLKHLANLNSVSKIVILGDMLELGNDEVEYHKNLKASLLASGARKFIAVGPLMRNLYDIVDEIDKSYFADYEELEQHFSEIVENNDLVLIKASKSMSLHKLVAKLQ